MVAVAATTATQQDITPPARTVECARKRWHSQLGECVCGFETAKCVGICSFACFYVIRHQRHATLKN